MKFIVTGGLGFIGSHIVEFLASQGHKVVAVDNLHSGKSENLALNSNSEYIKLDILEYEKLDSLCKNVDGIFHEAALTSVQESFAHEDRYNAVNVTGTENIFKIALDRRIKVVFASSAAVYGNVKKIPIRENFQLKPLNPYGKTKLRAEALASQYSKLGASIIGLRYFNVYGPRQNISYAGVITKFLERIAENKPPIIYGDGFQTRDFVHVKDVVRANLAAMTSNLNYGMFNIGSGIPLSVKDLAYMIIQISGLCLEPVYEQPLAGDIRQSMADIDSARKLLNWSPHTILKEWLELIIKSKTTKD